MQLLFVGWFARLEMNLGRVERYASEVYGMSSRDWLSEIAYSRLVCCQPLGIC
jgi:hypothetical protein